MNKDDLAWPSKSKTTKYNNSFHYYKKRNKFFTARC